MEEYKPWLTIKKGVKYAIFYGLPLGIGLLLDWYPELFSISVGSLLTMAVNWLKHRQK